MRSEVTRELRGELARKVVELDRSRVALDRRSRETPVQDLMHQMLLKLDEGKRD